MLETRSPINTAVMVRCPLLEVALCRSIAESLALRMTRGQGRTMRPPLTTGHSLCRSIAESLALRMTRGQGRSHGPRRVDFGEERDRSLASLSELYFAY